MPDRPERNHWIDDGPDKWGRFHLPKTVQRHDPMVFINDEADAHECRDRLNAELPETTHRLDRYTIRREYAAEGFLWRVLRFGDLPGPGSP
jgi:hypothetical protein